MSKAIAVLVSDLHLSHKAPIARSVEPNWYGVMLRQINWLKAFELPVICAGDVFDRWNPPPELINFAIENLPEMYAVPGQHDLPQHEYEQRHRTAYGTLVAAKKIVDIKPDSPVLFDSKGSTVSLWGFPWGEQLLMRNEPHPDVDLNIAVVHHYVWKPGKSYPDAPQNCRAKHLGSFLENFDAAVFGDNHIGFSAKIKGCSLHNNGGFICRNIDQQDYTPRVGLLHDDGSVSNVWQPDTDKDKWLDVAAAIEALEHLGNMAEFIADLDGLGQHGISFVDALVRFMDANDIAGDLRKRILKTANQ